MHNVFWDAQGIILLDFLEPGTTVNSERYITTLIKLKGKIAHTRLPYSPDLAPSNFYLFGPLKVGLRGEHFDNNAVIDVVKNRLPQLEKSFTSTTFSPLFIIEKNALKRVVTV